MYSVILYDFDAPAQGIQRARGRVAFHQDAIMLIHRVARMREMQGKIAVVGQEQKPTGVNIQASDRIDAQTAQFRWQQIKHGWSPLRIMGGTDVASRLMQQDIHQLFDELYRLPIDRDAVLMGIDTRALRRHDLAVDAHAPGLNQQFGMAARCHASMSEVTRQSLTFQWLLCHASLPTTMQAAHCFSRHVCAYM